MLAYRLKGIELWISLCGLNTLVEVDLVQVELAILVILLVMVVEVEEGVVGGITSCALKLASTAL